MDGDGQHDPDDLPRLLAAAAAGARRARHRRAPGRDRAGARRCRFPPGRRRGDPRGRVLHQLAHRRCRVRHAIGLPRLPRRPDRRRAPAPRGLRPRVRDAARARPPAGGASSRCRWRPSTSPSGGAASVPSATAPPSGPTWPRGSRGAGAAEAWLIARALCRPFTAARRRPRHRELAEFTAPHRHHPAALAAAAGRVHAGPHARDLAGVAARSAGAAHARGGGGDGGHARAAGPGPRHAGAAAARPRSHLRLRRPVLLPGAPGRRRAPSPLGMRRLLPRGYLFTVLGIAVGVAGLVALGAMAERITRFIEGGDRFVLGQISVAGEGMGMGAGFTAGGLLRAAKIAEIARVPGVAARPGPGDAAAQDHDLAVPHPHPGAGAGHGPERAHAQPELPRAARPGRPLPPGGRPRRRGAGRRLRRLAQARRGRPPRGGRPRVARSSACSTRRSRRRTASRSCPSRTRATSGSAAIRSSSSSSARAGSGAAISNSGAAVALAARRGSRRGRAPHPGVRAGRQRHDSRRAEPAPQGVDGVLLGAAPRHRRARPGDRRALARRTR